MPFKPPKKIDTGPVDRPRYAPYPATKPSSSTAQSIGSSLQKPASMSSPPSSQPRSSPESADKLPSLFDNPRHFLSMNSPISQSSIELSSICTPVTNAASHLQDPASISASLRASEDSRKSRIDLDREFARTRMLSDDTGLMDSILGEHGARVGDERYIASQRKSLPVPHEQSLFDAARQPTKIHKSSHSARKVICSIYPLPLHT